MLIFHHIPKTGGTSLQTVLGDRIKPSLLYEGGEGNLARLLGDKLKSIAFLTGHMSYRDIDAAPGPKRVITFLRDPKKRLLSLYHFWRSMRPEYVAATGKLGPALARKRSFVDFLRSPERFVRYHFDNAMVRPFLPTDYPLEPSLADRSPLELADMAIDRLRSRYHFVGFQETFEEDFEAVQRSVGLEPLPLHRFNDVTSLPSQYPDKFETVERAGVTPEVDAELDRLTSIDLPFYNNAKVCLRDAS